MKTSYEVEMRLNIKTPMRDGVELSSDLYLPKARGRFPTVLMRTPYSNNMDMMIEKGRALANNGYACVMQDTRGRWDSDGDHYPFHHDGPDGFDTQEWVGAQEWSNGKIGMSGSSYGGLVQLMSAPHRSRYLTCMAPRVICADFFGGLLYPGGALQLNVAMTWGMRTNGRTAQSIEYHNWTEAFRSLPIYDIDELAGRRLQFWKDWIDHPTYDDYWSAIDVEDKWGEVAAPSLNMGGWFDLYASDTFTNFNGQRKEGRTPESRQSRIIVGPWPHALSQSTKTGDVDFGAQSMVDLDALEMRWFDYWLKGIDNGIMDEPPVRLFIMGVNQWRDEGMSGPLPGRTGRSGTFIRAALQTRCVATGSCPPNGPARTRLTGSYTTPSTPCRPSAATTAARPTSSPGVPTTSAPWRCGTTCSASRPRRSSRIRR